MQRHREGPQVRQTARPGQDVEPRRRRAGAPAATKIGAHRRRRRLDIAALVAAILRLGLE